MTPRPASERLITPTFAALLMACLWYFLGTGMMLEAIPRYVRTALGGTDSSVGAAIGMAGLAAAVLRLPAGTLTDRKGRRWILILGCAVAAVSILGLLAAHSVGAVLGFRLLTGVADAAFFVGATAAMQDLAPDERRGEATSYFSAVAYVAVALGPVLAEWLIKRFSFELVWLVATGLCAVAGVLALRVPRNRQAAPSGRRFWPKPLLHPAARAPGAVLVIGLMGFASFMTFAALWATEVGIVRAGDMFLLWAAGAFTLRVLTARLHDRMGARTTTSIALSASAVGLAVLATWQTPTGAYLGTTVMACGHAFIFPALLTLVVERAPRAERGQAVGTFSMSFDLAFGAGGFLAGGVAQWFGGIPAAFWFGAAACGVALVVARMVLGARPGAVGPPNDAPLPPRLDPGEATQFRGF